MISKKVVQLIVKDLILTIQTAEMENMMNEKIVKAVQQICQKFVIKQDVEME
jgi:hypothetical protein